MERRQRLASFGIAALIAVVAIVVLATSGSDSSSRFTTGTPVLAAGQAQNLTYKQGSTVSFKVRSDTPDEVHVHGYDIHKEVAAGGEVAFSFPAKISGAFVVELENQKATIANLTVQP